MPTGSLCAERNAIGTAFATDISLRRRDLSIIAVYSFPTIWKTASLATTESQLDAPASPRIHDSSLVISTIKNGHAVTRNLQTLDKYNQSTYGDAVSPGNKRKIISLSNPELDHEQTVTKCNRHSGLASTLVN